MLNAGGGYITAIHQITLYLSLSFPKKIVTKQNIASTKTSQEFFAPKVPVLRRNKATKLQCF